MFIQASQLMHHDLVALETRQVIGKINGLIFDPMNGRLLALASQPRGWFTKKQYLAASDILGVEPGFIVTQKVHDLVNLSELERAQEVVKLKIRILRQKALTESGQKLGEVFDALLDTEAWQITKYYLRNLLSERILLAEDVHSITKKAVIFFDRVNEPGATGTVSESAAA
jgi:uncharacterized protein YrrD